MEHITYLKKKCCARLVIGSFEKRALEPFQYHVGNAPGCAVTKIVYRVRLVKRQNTRSQPSNRCSNHGLSSTKSLRSLCLGTLPV